MPKFTKDKHTVTTSNKREAVRLKAAGYREVKSSSPSKPDAKADSK